MDRRGFLTANSLVLGASCRLKRGGGRAGDRAARRDRARGRRRGRVVAPLGLAPALGLAPLAPPLLAPSLLGLGLAASCLVVVIGRGAIVPRCTG